MLSREKQSKPKEFYIVLMSIQMESEERILKKFVIET
jgi:hypothetical protein